MDNFWAKSRTSKIPRFFKVLSIIIFLISDETF